MDMTYDEMQSISAEILAMLSERQTAYFDEFERRMYPDYGKDMYEIGDSKISQIVSEAISHERSMPIPNTDRVPSYNSTFLEQGENGTWQAQFLEKNIERKNYDYDRVNPAERQTIAITQSVVEKDERNITEEISENIRRDSRRYDAKISKY